MCVSPRCHESFVSGGQCDWCVSASSPQSEHCVTVTRDQSAGTLTLTTMWAHPCTVCLLVAVQTSVQEFVLTIRGAEQGDTPTHYHLTLAPSGHSRNQEQQTSTSTPAPLQPSAPWAPMVSPPVTSVVPMTPSVQLPLSPTRGHHHHSYRPPKRSRPFGRKYSYSKRPFGKNKRPRKPGRKHRKPQRKVRTPTRNLFDTISRLKFFYG